MNFKEIIDELQSLDIQEPGRWSAPIRYGMAILLFLIVAIGSSYYVYKNKTPIVQQAQAEETRLRTEFETKQKKAANLEAYKQQLADMEVAFKGMLNQLPSRTELDQLIIDVASSILTAGLDEKEFKRQGEIRRDFYAEVPVNILVEGEYHQMADFVSKVAALPRIVTLENFEIQPAGSSRGGSSGSKDPDLVAQRDLQMKITAKTYRYLEEDELEGGGQ